MICRAELTFLLIKLFFITFIFLLRIVFSHTFCTCLSEHLGVSLVSINYIHEMAYWNITISLVEAKLTQILEIISFALRVIVFDVNYPVECNSTISVIQM